MADDRDRLTDSAAIWRHGAQTTKGPLIAGIRQWVEQRTGLTMVGFAYIHQLTYDDLLLLALAMGYPPTEAERRRIDWTEQQGIQKAAEHARWLQEHLEVVTLRKSPVTPIPHLFNTWRDSRYALEA
jgi:hypothetical protein